MARRWLVPLALALLAIPLILACEKSTPVLPFADDVDADGIATVLDNCPFDANADQLDCDRDGHGDACDVGDSDGAMRFTSFKFATS